MFFRNIIQHVYDSLTQVTQSRVLNYRELIDPENPSLQVVRKCVTISKDIGLEACARYNAAEGPLDDLSDLGFELLTFTLL